MFRGESGDCEGKRWGDGQFVHRSFPTSHQLHLHGPYSLRDVHRESTLIHVTATHAAREHFRYQVRNSRKGNQSKQAPLVLHQTIYPSFHCAASNPLLRPFIPFSSPSSSQSLQPKQPPSPGIELSVIYPLSDCNHALLRKPSPPHDSYRHFSSAPPPPLSGAPLPTPPL